MKHIRALFLVSLWLSSAQAAKPFQKVLVLSGGGFQSAVFLGMLQAAREEGWTPDAVMSTCGSSLAMAVAAAEPDSARWLGYLESEGFHRLLSSPRFEKNGFALIQSALQLLRQASAQKQLRAGEAPFPDLFGNFLMRVPVALQAPELERPFPTSGTRYLMGAARMLYEPKDVGQPHGGRRLVEETYFTDASTAQIVDGLRLASPVAATFHDAFVADSIRTAVGHPVIVAARASISDPYYMNPIPLGGNHYLAGSVDLYPLELAQALGDEVTMTYAGTFDDVEQAAVLTSYGYDNNARLSAVKAQSADHWVDMSDTDRFYAVQGFNPRKVTTRFAGVEVPNRLESGVPQSHDEYQKRVRAQWEYGRCRMREALKSPAFDKDHLGKRTCW